MLFVFGGSKLLVCSQVLEGLEGLVSFAVGRRKVCK